MREDVKYLREGEMDAYLFHQGTNYRSYNFLGSHHMSFEGEDGVRFVVWAPNARDIRVVGDFNDWNGYGYSMARIENTGLWEIFIVGLEEYSTYKYEIHTVHGHVQYKADPYAFHAETRPQTGSKTYKIDGYEWKDDEYIKKAKKHNSMEQAMNIYELNLQSWKHKEDGQPYSYLELIDELVPYVSDLGYTHVEFMPLIEFPYDGSWGYQSTGYFAATSRFGTPKDLMALIDALHNEDIGVIVDWVPAHFCKDDHGLRRFDGTCVFENDNPALAENEQWGTLNFDFHKPEISSFLISSAIFWFEYFHIDGIRVDAVAYMLYLDFGKAQQNSTNQYGGNENLEAIEFIRQMNKTVFQEFPYALMMAEESTAWPLVTAPIHDGGLGFNYKWNMGWMNDMLEYVEFDPVYRKYHHKNITFSYTYAFSENYLLPLSHDEVVHGKKSLLDKMPGDYWQKFANLRLLYLYQMGHPGKKLLFMGGEFGQFIEWDEWKELDWFLLDYEKHGQVHKFVKDLNHFYKNDKPLFEIDTSFDGFQWIDHSNADDSIIAFQRLDKKGKYTIFVCNFTPNPRESYRIGLPEEATYRYAFNSDSEEYGGSGYVKDKTFKAEAIPFHGMPYSAEITVPPLGGIMIKKFREAK